MHLDASVLHQPVPGTPAIRRLLIDGLKAAYQRPTGALFYLSASITARRDRAAILSIYTTLQDLAGAAGLTEPLPFLRGCASAARKEVDGLDRLRLDELVPAAARADGAPLPSSFVRLAFGAAPDTEAEAS